MQLLYLWKLSRPKYQQKLNKIMKISQEDLILIKKISICQSSMVHEGCRGNCPTRVENLEASTVCWREATRRVQLSRFHGGSVRPHLSHSSEKPCAQSGGQAKKASVSSLDFAWNCHSLFKYIQKNNSLWSPAHMLQMMSCSAVVWGQSYIPSH